MKDKSYKMGRYCQIPQLSDMLIEHIGYKSHGVFVEVGAFDCYLWSNTYGLATMGWRGLYFEPQLDEYNKCRELHASREKIEIVKMALSDWVGETDLFLGGSLSTIEKHQRDVYLSIAWSKVTGLASGKAERVQVSTLAHELETRSWPSEYDLLVVDVEGSEEAVISEGGLDTYRPKVIVIETHEENEEEELSKNAPWISTRLLECGYSKIYGDAINSIYVSDSG